LKETLQQRSWILCTYYDVDYLDGFHPPAQRASETDLVNSIDGLQVFDNSIANVQCMVEMKARLRLGFPVRSFAHILTAITIAVAVILLVWRRPLAPRRHLVPYLPILVFAFAAVGWPLLSAGFAWLGSINPDMSNYVLLAHRLAEQAYIQAPDPTVWRQQSDWVAYSVVYTAIGSRSGAELLLAWLIVLTGWNGVIVYMPLLIALHVALITTATALISTPHRYARLLAAVLLSSSATLTLGIVFQLLAQVLGLLLLALGSVPE